MIYQLDKILNTVVCGDCLEVMPEIPDKSIDMILCDLPYGTTACSWDTIIPFEPLWEQYKRIIKDNGAIVLTASQPFTSALVMSNPDMFKYDWIWYKALGSGFLNANKMPMRNHESILVFYKKPPTYNPQKTTGKMRMKGSVKGSGTENYGKHHGQTSINDSYFPQSVIDITNGDRTKENEHPTQKPVELFAYLIKTYTNEGDLVLDNCAGSGTTGVASKILNRNFILIEKEEKYCEIASQRLRQDVFL